MPTFSVSDCVSVVNWTRSCEKIWPSDPTLGSFSTLESSWKKGNYIPMQQTCLHKNKTLSMELCDCITPTYFTYSAQWHHWNRLINNARSHVFYVLKCVIEFYHSISHIVLLIGEKSVLGTLNKTASCWLE